MLNNQKMKGRGPIDFTLLFVTMLLVFIGLVMVFSSSWPQGIEKYNNQYYFFKRQFISAIIGIFALVFAMNFNYRNLDILATPIFLFSMGLALLTFTPLGVTRNNARRWLKLGITFMPSDIMKLASIIFLAARLRRRKNLNSFFKDLLPMLFIIGIPCGLILMQKDLSTTITVGATMMSMVYIAGARVPHLLLTGLSALGLIFIAIRDPDNQYRMARMTSFLDPFAHMQGAGWQVSQSLLALGSGGLFGTGLGKSRQKFFYIPEAHNDFIFAIIGEEIGFIGGVSILILYGLLIVRGVRIAVRARDPFGRYLATGITALIAVQSLINLGVVTSLLPPTGIPLPFISYGGTSLVMNMVSIGVLLNISRYSR